MPGHQPRSPATAGACQQSEELVTAENGRQLPDQSVDRTTPKPAPPAQRTRIERLAPGQYSQPQVSEQQQLPAPTTTVWWTNERRYQAALGQASYLPIQSRTIAGSRKRYQVRDVREWQLRY